jgi:hypothetical protein
LETTGTSSSAVAPNECTRASNPSSQMMRVFTWSAMSTTTGLTASPPWTSTVHSPAGSTT